MRLKLVTVPPTSRRGFVSYPPNSSMRSIELLVAFRIIENICSKSDPKLDLRLETLSKD